MATKLKIVFLVRILSLYIADTAPNVARDTDAKISFILEELQVRCGDSRDVGLQLFTVCSHLAINRPHGLKSVDFLDPPPHSCEEFSLGLLNVGCPGFHDANCQRGCINVDTKGT